MQTIFTAITVYIYGTLHILAGFVPIPLKEWLFPRTRLELLFFDGPHAEQKGRFLFGGLLRIAAFIGVLRGLWVIAFGEPWDY